MSFDNSKQVVMSKVVSDKPNAPKLRVTFEMNGQKFKAPLWPWTKKDGTPVTDKQGNQLYKGNYEEDNWEPAQSNSAQAAEAQVGRFADADDLPF